MHQYAIIQSHPPDNCPLTNKAVRGFSKKAFANLPALQKELKVKIVLNIHLDPAHKAFLLFEAPSAEAVRDLAVRAGLMHWSELKFYLVTPVEDLLKHIDDFPTIY